MLAAAGGVVKGAPSGARVVAPMEAGLSAPAAPVAQPISPTVGMQPLVAGVGALGVAGQVLGGTAATAAAAPAVTAAATTAALTAAAVPTAVPAAVPGATATVQAAAPSVAPPSANAFAPEEFGEEEDDWSDYSGEFYSEVDEWDEDEGEQGAVALAPPQPAPQVTAAAGGSRATTGTSAY